MLSTTFVLDWKFEFVLNEYTLATQSYQWEHNKVPEHVS